MKVHPIAKKMIAKKIKRKIQEAKDYIQDHPECTHVVISRFEKRNQEPYVYQPWNAGSNDPRTR